MSLNRLRLVTIVAPAGMVVGLELFSVFVLGALITESAERLVLTFGILVAGTILFSRWIFGIIEAQQTTIEAGAKQNALRHKQLQAANTTITAMSGNVEPLSVLQHIVNEARNLVGARYGALGVADASGRIQHFITTGITDEQRAAIGPLPQGRGLLGALIHEAKPIRLSRIQSDSRSSGFPPNHPPMISMLGVPIILQSRVVGNIYLTDKLEAPEFSEEDEDLLVLLADHAAVAVTNAELYEEARSTRDELRILNQDLEAKVDQRTAQIERQSREMSKRVLRAQEEERKRIARELHDETAQSLSTLLINIDLIESQSSNSETVHAGLDRVRTLAQRTLDETRALTHDLRPTILDDVGLVAAIQWFAAEWKKTFEAVSVDIQVDVLYRLPAEMELALFRIVQEALTNIGKYAEATRVNVLLEVRGESLRLIVRDNGRGFEPEATSRPSRHGGLGLYGMRERAELVGGAIHITSNIDQGTTIEVSAPTPQADPSAGNADALDDEDMRIC